MASRPAVAMSLRSRLLSVSLLLSVMPWLLMSVRRSGICLWEHTNKNN